MNSPSQPTTTPAQRRRATLGILGCLVLTGAHAATNAPTPAAPFTRITTGPVWSEILRSTVAAWGDYDNDGWLDLFIGNNQAATRNSLFHNNRDGTFTKVTTGPVATDAMDSTHSAAWLDDNNDGWLDLAIADLSGGGNRLYRNLGDGGFGRTRASDVGSFVADIASSVSISSADYDGDGWLDLFVANGALIANQNDFLYHNDGQGHFVRNRETPITSVALSTTQGSWADVDNDGDPDLFVTHSQDEGNALFRNDGGGRFVEVTEPSGLTAFADSVGSTWGDYDNDGDLDLFVTNLRLNGPNTRNLLYENLGDGTFRKITDGPIPTDLGHFLSAAWIDYDNDGWLDLFVSVNAPSGGSSTSVKNRLYRNLGEGLFAPVTEGSLVRDFANAGGAAWGDYDNDGFLDVIVANGTVYASQRNGLYHNDGNSNAWIKLKCVGTVSNRSAIGAKVRIQATIGGKERWQLRQVVGNEGWLTGNALDLVVGLGDATVIDTIRVEWPSGIIQELHQVAPRQALTITEGVTLTMTRVDEHMVQLTWPAGDHILESATDLAGVQWQPVPGVTGTSYRAVAEQQRYFRLRRP